MVVGLVKDSILHGCPAWIAKGVEAAGCRDHDGSATVLTSKESEAIGWTGWRDAPTKHLEMVNMHASHSGLVAGQGDLREGKTCNNGQDMQQLGVSVALSTEMSADSTGTRGASVRRQRVPP